MRSKKDEISRVFDPCPLCQSRGSTRHLSELMHDRLVCLNCGAKWHLYFSQFSGDLKWAKLLNENVNGKGINFLQREYSPEFWRRMTLRKRGVSTSYTPIMGTRKCIRCGAEISVSAVFCPKCGEKQEKNVEETEICE